MNPTSTLRMRRWTAFVAMAWALLAVFLSLYSLRINPDELSPPFSDSRLAGRAVIEALAPSAAGTGASPGDLILEIDGVDYLYRLREGSDWLRAGVANEYLIEKPDGRQIRFSLPPVAASVTRMPLDTLLHSLLLLV